MRLKILRHRDWGEGDGPNGLRRPLGAVTRTARGELRKPASEATAATAATFPPLGPGHRRAGRSARLTGVATFAQKYGAERPARSYQPWGPRHNPPCGGRGGGRGMPWPTWNHTLS